MKHNLTGKTIYCEECGGRMGPGDKHECPDPGERPETHGMVRCDCVDANGNPWPDCSCEHGWRRCRTGERPALDTTSGEVERLRDLVRYARSYLFNEELISPKEYAALVMDSDNGKRVARLEGYDALRSRVAELEAENKRLTGRTNSLAEQLADELVDHQRMFREGQQLRERVAELERENVTVHKMAFQAHTLWLMYSPDAAQICSSPERLAESYMRWIGQAERISALEAENRKLTEYRDQIDILRDSEYISALKFGWNLGQADSSAVFHQAIAARRREIVRARRPE